MRRDEIEFFSEIGQRDSRMNPRDHAADIEQFGSASEERLLVGIEAESFVAEEPADVKEISSAAPKIENVQWWAAIQPEILGVLDVSVDPIRGILVGVNLSRVRPIRIMLAQPG